MINTPQNNSKKNRLVTARKTIAAGCALLGEDLNLTPREIAGILADLIPPLRKSQDDAIENAKEEPDSP